MSNNPNMTVSPAEQRLRALVEHRWRAGIVMTITFAIGLITIWPAADEYFALRSYNTELVRSLVEAKTEAESLEELEAKVLTQESNLANLESKAVDIDDTYHFREQLIELTRQAGCHLRRLDLGASERRPWRKGDNPLDTARQKKDGTPSPFELRTQSVRLVVAGPIEGVVDFMSRMQESDKLMHTTTLSLRSATGGSEDVEIEMELLLLNLSKKTGPATT